MSCEDMLIVTTKLARVLVWVVFFVVHVVLVVAMLFTLWWFQLSPDVLQRWASSLSHSPLGTSAHGIAIFAGLSGLAVLIAYQMAQYLMTALTRSGVGASASTRGNSSLCLTIPMANSGYIAETLVFGAVFGT